MIGTLEQMRWLYKKLGPLAFSNPNLLIANEDDAEEISKLGSGTENEKNRHQDIFKMLCYNCKHEIFLTDLWDREE
jgi:hypothetical protein